MPAHRPSAHPIYAPVTIVTGHCCQSRSLCRFPHQLGSHAWLWNVVLLRADFQVVFNAMLGMVEGAGKDVGGREGELTSRVGSGWRRARRLGLCRLYHWNVEQSLASLFFFSPFAFTVLPLSIFPLRPRTFSLYALSPPPLFPQPTNPPSSENHRKY